MLFVLQATLEMFCLVGEVGSQQVVSGQYMYMFRTFWVSP